MKKNINENNIEIIAEDGMIVFYEWDYFKEGIFPKDIDLNIFSDKTEEEAILLIEEYNEKIEENKQI